VLNGRLYRMALVPFLFALAIAAFSLTARPAALTSTLAPDAFEGQRAFAGLTDLASKYPDRRPGSGGDEALARYIARTLEGLGGTAGGGFSVRTTHSAGQTIDGQRRLTTVIAQRPGSTNATPVVLVAHRDAAARGSKAQLSGTAALLELARVFASRETKRTIILVSSSGGSGGDAGAADLASAIHEPVDAAIVLGDVAGAQLRRPFVVPYSEGFGSAPLQLQRTVADAITREAGSSPGAPSVLGQLAHLAVPFAAGEQGVLGASGLPAVLVQVSGEHGPGASTPVSSERMEGIGRAVLSAVGAMDSGRDIASSPDTGVLLQRKVLPVWAVRLLVATLLLGPLLLAADGLARARRRRLPVGRWTLWTLSCALPFLACALLAYLLGLAGVIPAPSVPAVGSSLPFDAGAAAAVVAVALVFAFAWLLWAGVVRHQRWGVRPDPEIAGLAALLVLIGVALFAWVSDPFTALLMVPALHLWLLVASPELRPRRGGLLALLGLGVAPLALLLAFYAHQLGLGLGGLAWAMVLLVAGGHVGLGGAILWSLALGATVAAGMLTARPRERLPRGGAEDEVEITIRGPLSYAGPGSLGGTESALRR
jgi:peptidase M28-like protein